MTAAWFVCAVLIESGEGTVIEYETSIVSPGSSCSSAPSAAPSSSQTIRVCPEAGPVVATEQSEGAGDSSETSAQPNPSGSTSQTVTLSSG